MIYQTECEPERTFPSPHRGVCCALLKAIVFVFIAHQIDLFVGSTSYVIRTC